MGWRLWFTSWMRTPNTTVLDRISSDQVTDASFSKYLLLEISKVTLLSLLFLLPFFLCMNFFNWIAAYSHNRWNIYLYLFYFSILYNYFISFILLPSLRKFLKFPLSSIYVKNLKSFIYNIHSINFNSFHLYCVKIVLFTLLTLFSCYLFLSLATSCLLHSLLNIFYYFLYFLFS